MSEQITDRDVLDAMHTFGGSFVSALALAWGRADAGNSAKLKAAFPEVWEQYAELVQLRRSKA